MATYKAKGTYNDRPLTAQDAAKVTQYKQAYETAKAAGDTVGMQKAHDAAQAIRAGYGYSGGDDGSENLSIVQNTMQKDMAQSTPVGAANKGSRQNQSSTVQNAQAALSQVPQMSNADWTSYNRQGITSQQGALDMMRLGSNLWNSSQYDTIRNGLADENAAIAQTWFPGAKIDPSGVWYYNGRPLYDQDFSQSTFRPEGDFGGGYIPGANSQLEQAAQQMAGVTGLPGMVARSGAGETYTIGSQLGQDWVRNAEVGKKETMVDGSQWTKNPDGSVTITKNGKTYHYSNGGLVDQYGTQIAQALNGDQYTIGSYDGLNFLYNGAVGESMEGGDGSIWIKNADGTVTVNKNGQQYTIQGNPVGLPEMPEFTAFDQTAAGQQMLTSLNDLYDQLNNYKAFSYDPNTDPLYLQYADSYTRGGQRAMTDILGQLAARTGGLASSYAGSMAQQTYDNYMADLANKIPELQQLAYSMYVDDYNRDVGRYDRARAQYADAYDRYNQDYQTQYGQYRDNVSDMRWNLQNAQERAADAKSDYWKGQELQWQKDSAQKEFDYRKEQDALAREDMMRQEQAQNLSQLIDMIQGGYIPTEEDAIRYNLTPAQLAQYRKWAIENNSQKSDKWHISGAY